MSIIYTNDTDTPIYVPDPNDPNMLHFVPPTPKPYNPAKRIEYLRRLQTLLTDDRDEPTRRNLQTAIEMHERGDSRPWQETYIQDGRILGSIDEWRSDREVPMWFVRPIIVANFAATRANYGIAAKRTDMNTVWYVLVENKYQLHGVCDLLPHELWG
ncbi:MAG: hypothetical protein M1837_000518 [Sclerophora amabilis]|nr:MAG: hypothetical protein M1837_000518 [Sclerophora amabilis]